MTSMTTSDGRRLAYRRFGSGPLLVGHPGGPGFESGSLRDLGGLDEDFELVLLDPRGTGGSDDPLDKDFELDRYAQDLGELLEHLDQSPDLLLGHSHGGLVALMHAAAHPQSIDRLLLIATPTHVDVETFFKLGSQERGSSPSPVPRREEFFGVAPGVAWGAAGIPFEDALGDEDVAYDALAYFNDHVLTSFDLRPICEKVSVPTLVVCGRDDRAAGPEQGSELVERLPDATLAVIESSGHVPYVENPDAFRAAVTEFVAA